MAAESLEYAAERLAQVQTVQVFAQEGREAAAFSQLSESGYDMARQYAVFQVKRTVGQRGLCMFRCSSIRRRL